MGLIKPLAIVRGFAKKRNRVVVYFKLKRLLLLDKRLWIEDSLQAVRFFGFFANPTISTVGVVASVFWQHQLLLQFG